MPPDLFLADLEKWMRKPSSLRIYDLVTFDIFGFQALHWWDICENFYCIHAKEGSNS